MQENKPLRNKTKKRNGNNKSNKNRDGFNRDRKLKLMPYDKKKWIKLDKVILSGIKKNIIGITMKFNTNNRQDIKTVSIHSRLMIKCKSSKITSEGKQ